ncbi:Crp/Fnr family transcriptional regulator [Tetragenococcus koreensis]|uniref:Crp/Fnr family transcriptional regulator n=1 Tax=Tetragenococcus koreensis TaxID=290335 RepID=UPI000F4FA421|nr:Crp/Fnr family transcriptional regulator [Tetragenococcus koreensis]AYW46805.1 Crp/Fnr family transcriptional regulator [Tetragenococcus koreensis]MCF1584616.1 Crp/Fnr family transcriptional regulator [Tetragenococcus koreensis]MCF1614168.1 Crp/Fnr family transcriptional regulator [Tetragenococcus koreensis]MCF1619704.1 Crp/Fnr family transcriptional regulator [Tetragenococcus koreensis]MCF1623951.1 Crp/Fnr family transcriptional regulator [Tetragenococcus koreensis]
MQEEHLCVTLVPLFNHLELEDQKRIHQLVRHVTYEKGEAIVSPYDDPQLVIVAKGLLKVYQLFPSGKEQLLRVVEPGGYEGENALFGVKNNNLFSESLQKTEVCVLKQSDFQKLLKDYPQLSLKLLTINAEKNAKVEEQTQFLTMERIEERLATYLLDLAKAAESSQVKIPMKMKELAGFLGTTPETLSRKLKTLEEAQLIKREKQTIQILDAERLEEI